MNKMQQSRVNYTLYQVVIKILLSTCPLTFAIYIRLSVPIKRVISSLYPYLCLSHFATCVIRNFRF